MATYLSNGTQSLSEVRTHIFDFTDDLRTGVTVSSATAIHTPPSGSASTISPTTATPYVYATIPAQTIAGVHLLSVLGTLSDGDKSEITVTITFPAAVAAITARAGLSDLRDTLRSMTDTTEHDWKIGNQNFWDDSQLDKVLDRWCTDVDHELLVCQETYETTGGTVSYHDYYSQYGSFEGASSGTAYFLVQDATGTAHGTSEWTADYNTGCVTFTANTLGSSMYLTGYAYDLNAAAADIWNKKAAHYASAFDFSTDNHNIRRSQLIENCFRMAKFYEQRAGNTNQGASTGFTVIDVVRGDMPGEEYEE